jgi:electron transfer flavoprotein beta subunit
MVSGFNSHLIRILQAKKKPLEALTTDAITGVDFAPQNKVVSIEEPASRQAGIVVDSVDALIDNLRNKAKVI